MNENFDDFLLLKYPNCCNREDDLSDNLRDNLMSISLTFTG